MNKGTIEDSYLKNAAHMNKRNNSAGQSKDLSKTKLGTPKHMHFFEQTFVLPNSYSKSFPEGVSAD